MTADLASALNATDGTTCVVGAGGKKTLLYRLAADLPRAVVTATVRIPIFDSHVTDVTVIDDPVEAVRLATEWPIGVVPAREGSRYRGYDPETVDRLSSAGGSSCILIKADGARNRLFKAPGAEEPIIPSSTDTVIPIASAKIVGKPLDDAFVHRPERVADLTGRSHGAAITTEDVASVVASDRGGLKAVPPGATVVPVINMVDDGRLVATGRAIADGILSRSRVPRVVLTKLIADNPVMDVVHQ